MTLLAIAGLGVTIAAGRWQDGRALEKTERQRLLDERGAAPVLDIGRQPLDAAQVAWRRVRIEGEFVGDRTVLLDNRIHQKQAGYHVLTPVRVAEGAPHVLVNRGWIAQGGSRETRPAIPVPSGPVAIEGVAQAWPERVFELKAETPESPSGQHPVWQNVTRQRYEAATRLPMQPVLVLQTSDAPDALVRDWPRPAAGIQKHRMYSLQWYSFAALIVVLYLVLNLKRPGARAEPA